MFNNINDNNRDLLFNSQYNTSNVVNLASVRAAIRGNAYIKNPYVDKTDISSDAINLLQKDLDIKKFTQIVTNDMNDSSYLDKMKELFADGVIDVYEDDVMSSLVTNSKLWDDLGL